MDIKSEIVQFANEIGVYYIGFSDTNFNSKFIEELLFRKEKGFLSGFEESDYVKRINVKGLMKEAKTIISIAVPYKTIDIDKSKPYFSKSSLGIDYHKVVINKLSQISDFIKEKYNGSCLYFCDIGPLADREIAKKCGVGFYGKNTCIITEKFGSYVFLGEIITDIYIDRDKEKDLNCNNCDLCIKACPVQAIEMPYRLNAKKCLSYISQKKERLSLHEIDHLGTRIYGCDTCQDVCPYNRNAEKSNIEEFMPEKWNYDVDINYILSLSNKEFKNSIGLTSAGWRGKKIIMRNAIIAAGNSGREEYLTLLKKIDADDEMKYYVDIAIRKINDKLK
ncbi:(Fe-S)-binding protein [Fervidicella metallireducens AeB]|uniref:(Fe-S)-binding protein n=1 Tax=Fervidicella metallireducens AeB TaxID=1403537 RepID=A0A017RXG1_9CLOT|nr:tRNA epoxyqueuosine(34) reductase QueG [Fervidicella metallireducens]EYE89059.1 (Fe-S)-binding protein [Fervidicella metallireducens AeB]